MFGNSYQVGVRGEHVYDRPRKKLTEQKAQGGGADSAEQGVFQGTDYPVVLFGSEIISHNRLHALIESHDDHKEQERNPVDNSECTHIHVATEVFQAVVDEQHHQA